MSKFSRSKTLAAEIRMLGSTQDGDILNAARALIRTLAADGYDLHDLASYVQDDLYSADQMQLMCDEAVKAGRAQVLINPAKIEPEDLHEMALYCQQHPDKLYDDGRWNDHTFIDDMVDRTEWKGSLSAKQESLLRRIYHRVKRAVQAE